MREDEARWHELWRCIQSNVRNWSRNPQRDGIDIEEAAIATIEFFWENPSANCSVESVLRRCLRREKERRLRFVTSRNERR